MRNWIKPEQYVSKRFEEAAAEVPQLSGDAADLKAIRQMSYLNITRFMPTLLDRKDRMSMAAGLEVRVPFCDHRLVEYVFNIPWDYKTSGDREKGILRQALKGILPDEIIHRKKSRSEEHTSELQSRENLVCRLLLEKKKSKEKSTTTTISQKSKRTSWNRPLRPA